ncbi:unnamed protein product, partial [Closterium sp. NIES-54]
MADSSPPQSFQGPSDSTPDMDIRKKPISSRRGTKLLAIPLPEPPPSTSFVALHRSTKTTARTPAESSPAAGLSSACRRASPLPRDAAVALTPALSSTPQPRGKPHHAPPHPPPRRPTAVETGAECPLEASGTMAPCRRAPRQAPHSPCCKLHWRRVFVVVKVVAVPLHGAALEDHPRWSSGETGGGNIPQNAGEKAPASMRAGGSGDVDSAVIADPQIDGGGGGICVAIPSSPRAFPHQELPPWHFPVALLKLLDERHSRRDSAQGGEQRGGLGEMHAVVYSAGCKASVPAAFSSNRRQRMGRLRLIRVAKSVEDMEADFVVEETKKTNEMVGVYTGEIERAAEGLSIRVDVLRAHEDVCRFIGQEEGDLRRGGVKDKMVGKDGWESWKWRTKLVMDFVYVARQCLATRPKYVLLLQDDTLPAKLYDVGIEKFVREDLAHKSWGVVSLYNPQSYNWKHQHGDEYQVPCCAQALLFNVTTLEGMLQYMEEHFMETNMDLLVSKYLDASGIKGNVSNTNINGTIKGVSALTALALLDMSNNPIKDVAPLAPLTNLVYLNLEALGIKAAPNALGNLGLLKHLNLNQNYLSTPLPPFVTALTALTHLDLGFNDFSGSLPPGFGNLKNLKKLVLSHGGDALGGKLPSSFSSLTNLRELYMNDNAFGGSIPAYIGSFLSLSYLRLSNNMFSGNIPKELSRLKSLQFLGLRYNWLTGSIPAALASLPQLTYLSLNYNKLSGSIPAQLTRLANIQSINLESNYLSGTLPNIDRLKLLTD